MSEEDLEQMLQAGVQQHQRGRLDEAEQIYRRILHERPEHPDALHLLGLILLHRNEKDAALDLLKRAVAARPEVWIFQLNLGNALQEANQLDESLACYQAALALQPDAPEGHNNLGNVLLRLGRVEEAIEQYREAIRLRPQYIEAYGNLSGALRSLSRLEAAEEVIGAAQRIYPESSACWRGLAEVQRLRGRYPEALELGRRAVESARQENAQAQRAALVALGQILKEMDRHEEALAAFRSAMADDAGSADAMCGIASVLKDRGSLKEAVNLYRRALQIRPRLGNCYHNFLMALCADPDCGPEQLLTEHVQWARIYEAPLMPERRAHANDRSPDRRLRVGYVSADFRDHSVSRFVIPLLKAHDRGTVEVIAYSNVARPDAVTGHIRSLVDAWNDAARMTDRELTEKIRSDRVDVLVDLSGHTGGDRLGVFARKPAPLQVAWLGYPATTGLAAMDYRVTDALADPPGQSDSHYTEKLHRLSRCFVCYEPPETTPDVSAAPCARAGHVTFGCFNNTGKLTPPVMTAWGQIMRAVEGSRLVVKAVQLVDETTRRMVRDLLAQHGVPIERLDVLAPQTIEREHLAAYGEIDIALDTWPYNGTTTTCEAMWMGVAPVTLSGETHASRVGSSLLTAVGLTELIATSMQEYELIAVSLATDVERLSALRGAMRQRMQRSELMNAGEFARAMESAYREMWKRWCAGEDGGERARM